MTAIIDYDAGNLKSVEKALQALGEKTIVTRDREKLLAADRVILPGVGAFGEAMEKLIDFGLIDVIKEIVENKIPLLGICLGMQLLFDSSEESIGVEGLGILEGKICKIPYSKGLKIPHMGWNSINVRDESKLFKGIENGEYVYFLHSYYLVARDEKIVAATTDYSTNIHAAVEAGNIFACQFHPEKSSDVGMCILKNFVMISKGGN